MTTPIFDQLAREWTAMGKHDDEDGDGIADHAQACEDRADPGSWADPDIADPWADPEEIEPDGGRAWVT